MSFVRYNPEDSVVSSEEIIKGLFSGDVNGLSLFFTSSVSEYYTDVYNASPSTNPSASVQFSAQYGNLYGSGSTWLNASVPGISPTRIVYGQYRNLVYGTETTNFTFTNSGVTTTPNGIFIINFARSRYKKALLPGSITVKLKYNSNALTLTDDSNTSTVANFIGENQYYNMVSSGTTYGYLFPNLDIIVLNADKLVSDGFIASITGSSNTAEYNQNKLIVSSATAGIGGTVNSLLAQSDETVSSRYFFTRVKNSDFNYTTNPSIIDNNGNLLFSTLINNPQTYVTTVGLYNDNNELLAVAKLSQPLIKDFTKEALIRIKLDY
jgi:hypothetical protein